MSAAALAWVNRSDSGTITASGSVALAPPSNLQTKHISQKWRDNSTSSAVICDLGSTVAVSTVALVGLNSTSAPTRVRLSLADTTGLDGSAYDSGTLPGTAYDANYLPFVHLFTQVSGRYLRIDLTGVSYIEAGRLFAGTRTAFSINMQPGWARTWMDPEIRTIGRSGQTFDDLRDRFRMLEFAVDLIPETERYTTIEAVDVALGTHGDMLVITDPASSNLSRDSIWGYLEQADPVVEPIGLPSTDRRFRRSYRVRERL